MSSRFMWVLLSGAVLVCCEVRSQKPWVTTDELDNHISPDDLRAFVKAYKEISTSTEKPNSVYISAEDDTATSAIVPHSVDCFGFGLFTNQLSKLFINMRPDSSDVIDTHFFFYSRQQPYRVQVLPGAQFGLEWVDFKPNRRTIMIVHGFLSHSNASWVCDMAQSFLKWEDVNVLTVDWSGGSNSWKYWRAVANTRRVGSEVVQFLKNIIAQTGARIKDFHFIGHSLGAHICAFVSWNLGGVSRITGLDPAQPCFRTSNISERLDKSDADFVDVIHTNGRLLKKIGFGLPEPLGHADFYPNGGMQQPGCLNNGTSRYVPFLSQLQQGICSHGRAYLLFTESLINNNCSFRAYHWNLSYEGVNDSLKTSCDRLGSCSEMGIKACGGSAMPRAKGPYFVLTTEKVPYCPTEAERRSPAQHLLKDLREGFQLLWPPRPPTTGVPDYADPDDPTSRDPTNPTTKKSWLSWWR